MNGMGFGMGFGWIWMIILVIIILAGIYFFTTGFTQERRASYTSTSSLEILKQRYAKGEITEEEFKRIKKELE
jgi:putative membrane protein